MRTRTTAATVPDSEESEDELNHTPGRGSAEREPSQPQSVLSHRFRESPRKEAENRARKSDSVDSQSSQIAVMVAPPARPWEYQKYRGDTTVESVLEELEGDNGQTEYKIEYEDGRKAIVSGPSLSVLMS